MFGCHRTTTSMPSGMAVIEGVTSKTCLAPVSSNPLSEEIRLRLWNASAVSSSSSSRRSRTRSSGGGGAGEGSRENGGNVSSGSFSRGDVRSRFQDFRSSFTSSAPNGRGSVGSGRGEDGPITGGGGGAKSWTETHKNHHAASRWSRRGKLDGGESSRNSKKLDGNAVEPRWTRGFAAVATNVPVGAGAGRAGANSHIATAGRDDEDEDEDGEDMWDDAPPAGASTSNGLEMLASQTRKCEEMKTAERGDDSGEAGSSPSGVNSAVDGRNVGVGSGGGGAASSSNVVERAVTRNTQEMGMPTRNAWGGAAANHQHHHHHQHHPHHPHPSRPNVMSSTSDMTRVAPNNVGWSATVPTTTTRMAAAPTRSPLNAWLNPDDLARTGTNAAAPTPVLPTSASRDPVIVDSRAASWGASAVASMPSSAAPVAMTTAPSRPEPSVGREWWYQDPHGRIQGPFAGVEMRSWLDQGFFQQTLPVRCGTNVPFLALGDIYQNRNEMFIFRPTRSFAPPTVVTPPVSSSVANNNAPPSQRVITEDTRSLMNALNLRPTATANASMGKRESASAAVVANVAASYSERSFDRVMTTIETVQEERRRLQHLEDQRRRAEDEQRRRAEDEQRRRAEDQRRQAAAAKAATSAWSKKTGTASLPAPKKVRSGGGDVKTTLLDIQADERKQRSIDQAKRDEEMRAKREEKALDARSTQQATAWGAGRSSQKTKSFADIQAEEERMERARRKAREQEMAETGARRSGQTMAERLGGGGTSRRGLTTWTQGSGVTTTATTTTSSHSRSLLDVQADQLAERRKRAEMQRKAALSNGVGAGAGPSNYATMAKQIKGSLGIPSFRDIQTAEAARKRREMEMTKRPGSGGGSGASAWSRVAVGSGDGAGSMRATSAGRAPESTDRSSTEQTMFWNASSFAPRGGASSVPTASTGKSKQGGGRGNASGRMIEGSGSSSNNFGGQTMPAAMLQWCKQELRKITKSEDETLVKFCYTLESSVDIREYMRNYMGSTPQVSAFASEFIRRKSRPGKFKSGGSSASSSSSKASQSKASQSNQRRRRRRR
eukprot:g4439.t1